MRRRLVPALLLALALAPGTFVRTAVPDGPPVAIALRQVSGAAVVEEPGWRVEGVWEYQGDNLMFGGFSALLPLKAPYLRAFSDRGARMTMIEPDRPQPEQDPANMRDPARNIVRQLVEPPYANDLWDIEAATLDPATGTYWLGFENVHAIHRFAVTSATDGVRLLGKEVDWTINSGAEAMERLADGRFLIIPESGGEALLYPRDPILGDAPARLSWRSPVPGFGITDVKQLPDGRLLILLRNVIWGVPPFEARLAIAELPPANALQESAPQEIAPQEIAPQEIAPRIALDLTRAIPPENYEGLALRARGDGMIDVWIISDDNLSVMQRTLLAKLVLDPALLPPPANEKARDPEAARPSSRHGARPRG